MKDKNKSIRKIIFNIVISILLTGYIFTLGINHILVMRTTGFGSCMTPILNNSKEYELRIKDITKYIKYGDVISIKNYKKYQKDSDYDFVQKRVIGLPGDHIYIDQSNGDVYINNELHNEYSSMSNKCEYIGKDVYYDIVLNKDEYFIMGDNRNGSNDSRSFGPIKGQDLFSFAIADDNIVFTHSLDEAIKIKYKTYYNYIVNHKINTFKNYMPYFTDSDDLYVCNKDAYNENSNVPYKYYMITQYYINTETNKIFKADLD